jgi:hypothetical protein
LASEFLGSCYEFVENKAYLSIFINSQELGNWCYVTEHVGYFIFALYFLIRSWGSSVSIVSDYGLDDRGSIPDRGRGFFL